MNRVSKNNHKISTALLLGGCLCILTSFKAFNISPYTLPQPMPLVVMAELRVDTVPSVKKDSIIRTTDTLPFKVSKDSIEAPVKYEAADSMVLDVPTKKIILYSKGKVSYQDLELTADSIALDQKSNTIFATYRTDTSGKIVGRPVMIQADTKTLSDQIQYNFKTQRGLTQNSYTEQGEMHVNIQQSKKITANEYFGFLARLSTCNLDTPHFAFRTNKMKLINKKLAVTGPIHPEFEGVPVPIYLPFGFFPLSQGRHSGILAPQFTASEQFGLGLEGLGYYKVLNDYFDVTLRSNLYSYGGWNLYFTPTYRVRYRYSGSMNFSYQSTRILSRSAVQEFTNSKTFNVTWSHTVDSRARPGTSFSANVNAGSTKYNQYVANNMMRNFQNQLNSSITYSKTWGDLFNMSLSATHNQNNNTGLVNLNLPNMTFAMNTIYPFQKKEFVGTPKWYEKLGIGLNTNLGNQISFYDSAFSFRRLLDTIQWGAQHNIPIQLSLPPLGPFQIGPGISLQQKWYSQKFTRTWNNAKGKVDTVINKGFYTSNDVAFSMGISTAVFGMFDRFGKKSNLKAIRHVIRPTVSANYKPDMSAGNYYETQIDTAGHKYRFSYYDGSLFGSFGEGRFGGLSFGIDNNIEAKIRDKNDTTENAIKKVKLIDGFGFNGSYNFLADSFQLSPISLYARSTLFEVFNITAGATLDPYKTDASGFRTKEYTWSGTKRSFPNIVNGSVAVSASFKSKTKEKEKPKEDTKLGRPDPGMSMQTMEEQQMQLDYARRNPAEFVDFNVPWNLSISYSLNFNRQFARDYSGFQTEVFSNLNASGDFSLTPRWKIGMSGYYDFKTHIIQSVTTFITREMHCWQLSINVTPVGLYRSFNITVNPKSGLLRDLKFNRTRYFYGN